MLKKVTAFLFLASIITGNAVSKSPNQVHRNLDTQSSRKQIILTSRILHSIDGIHGIMDRVKIENTLWLIQELRHIHNGQIKVNSQGIPDPARSSTHKDLTFKGKRCTLKDLIDIENKNQHTPLEQRELEQLFTAMKEYCEKVNNVILADAHGTEHFMKELIHEYCDKAGRQDSLLLEWNKGAEIDMYRKTITSFKTFHTFSSDLINFLATLITSCPKAFKQYKDHVKSLSTTMPS